MTPLRLFIFLFLGLGSFSTFAASAGGSSSSSSSKGDNGIGWIGAGGGNISTLNPKSDIAFGGIDDATIGMEYDPIKGGMIGFVLGGNWSMTNGNHLNYDYTSQTNIHYTASNVSFTTTTTELYAGIKLKLINANAFRFYGEGGGSYGSMNLNYDVGTNSTITSKGSDYSSSDTNVRISGLYGESGVELIPFAYGIKVAARYTMHTSGEITSLASQKIRYEEVYAYAALIHTF